MPDEPDDLGRKCGEILFECACLQLRKASRAVTQVFDEILRPSGIRATQLPVLVTLYTRQYSTVGRVAGELVMDRTSLTRLLKPLQNGGFIKSSRGKDRRTRQVSLTTLGRQTVVNTIPLWEKAQAHIVTKLGERRWRRLHADLATVVSTEPSG